MHIARLVYKVIKRPTTSSFGLFRLILQERSMQIIQPRARTYLRSSNLANAYGMDVYTEAPSKHQAGDSRSHAGNTETGARMGREL